MPAVLVAVDLGAFVLYLILAAMVVATEQVWYPAIDRITGAIPLVGGLAKSAIMSIVHGLTGDYLALYDAVSRLFGMFWVAWGQSVLLTGYASLELATALESGLLRAGGAAARAVVGVALIPVHAAIRAEQAARAALAHYAHAAIAGLEHDVTVIDHDLAREIRPAIRAIEHTALPALRSGERALEHELGSIIRPDLAKLAREAATLGATVALVEADLKLLNPLKCDNVGTLAKWLCGLDPSLLQLLLAGLSDALVLQLLQRAHVDPLDPIHWAGQALSELETVASTF